MLGSMPKRWPMKCVKITKKEARGNHLGFFFFLITTLYLVVFKKIFLYFVKGLEHGILMWYYNVVLKNIELFLLQETITHEFTSINLED